MYEHEEPERLADDLERETDRLEQRSNELGDEIKSVREDWERKRSDSAVPGAAPTREQSDRDGPGDDVNPEDADR